MNNINDLVPPPNQPKQPLLSRTQALQMLKRYLSNQNLIKHSLAAEAAMKGLCVKLNPQATPEFIEKWGIAGLLHDGDYERAKGRPEIHGKLLIELEPYTIPDDIAYAIKAHNPQTKIEPKSQMDWAIRTVDQLTGLIVAAALVLPDKKLASLTAESILKRMKEKSFAKGADRTQIKLCEEKLGIPLPEFVAIALKAMQGISNNLEL